GHCSGSGTFSSTAPGPISLPVCPFAQNLGSYPIRVGDYGAIQDSVGDVQEISDKAELVGEATTGKDVITFSATLQPDVILMDLKMPDVNGIEATRRIVQTSPHIGILVLTMFKDDDSVLAQCVPGHAATY